MASRKKVCGSKDSFWSKERAETVAKKWGQRVYECPVCFCWHCTSKENWREEFIDEDTARRRMVGLEYRLRTEFNVKIKTLNARINELQRENKRLKELLPSN